MTIGDGEPRTPTSTFTEVLNVFKCCFTSTETISAIRHGEPRTATSTFTQLLTLRWPVSLRQCLLLPVMRGVIGRNVSAHMKVLKRISFVLIRPTPALIRIRVQYYTPSTETAGIIRDGESRTATSTFTHLLNSMRAVDWLNVALRPQKP